MQILFKEKSVPLIEGINNETEVVGYKREYEPVFPEGWQGVEAQNPSIIVRYINGYWDLEAAAEDGDYKAMQLINKLRNMAKQLAKVVKATDPSGKERIFILYKEEHLKQLEKIAWE